MSEKTDHILDTIDRVLDQPWAQDLLTSCDKKRRKKKQDAA